MDKLPKRAKREKDFRWIVFGQAGSIVFALVDPRTWSLKPKTFFVSDDMVRHNLARLSNISRQVEGNAKVLLLSE